MPVNPSPIATTYVGHSVVRSSCQFLGTQMAIRNGINKRPNRPPISSKTAPMFALNRRTSIPSATGIISPTMTVANSMNSILRDSSSPSSLE